MSWTRTSALTVRHKGIFVVLALVLLICVAAILIGAVGIGLGRSRHFNDVERFHRARGITTGWARDGITRPRMADHAAQAREPVDAVDAD